MGSNPIRGFACLCKPIQCVCTSLGPTKPGRDDLDSIFQERRRKITLVGKLSKSSRRCFGNVPTLAPANFSLPTAHTGSVWGCQEYRHAHFHHSSLACKGRVAFCTVRAFIRSLFSLVGRARKREVMGSKPIGGFACLCKPIQCVCTSLGPTKPGRDDFPPLFWQCASLGACKLQPPDSPHRQRLGLSGVSACALPSFQPCLQGKGGVLRTSYLELEHSSGASLA